MTVRKRFKTLLLIGWLSGGIANGAIGAPTSGQAPQKTGYEVDGRTSASVLAAKRSHQVTDQDRFGLGLYSGVFAIGLIVFFAHLLNEKK